MTLYGVFWLHDCEILAKAFEAESKEEAIQKAIEDIREKFGIEVDEWFLLAGRFDKEVEE